MAGSRLPGDGRKRGGKRKWTEPELKVVHYRNHSCPDSKVVYPSRKEAKRAARLLQGRGYDLMTPYDCPRCGLIHLGHSRRRGF